jgi:hypothetical protein
MFHTIVGARAAEPEPHRVTAADVAASPTKRCDSLWLRLRNTVPRYSGSTKLHISVLLLPDI